MDAHSRYLLACVALRRPDARQVRRAFERIFDAFGFPEAIRTDNGPPFATPRAAAQQRAFDRFRHEYNDIRPHEALGQELPAALYQ
jgi:transposase InsO family protein